MFPCDGKVMDTIMRQVDGQTREGEAIQSAHKDNLVRKKRQAKDEAKRRTGEMEVEKAQ